jgi:hypothetical protein
MNSFLGELDKRFILTSRISNLAPSHVHGMSSSFYKGGLLVVEVGYK